MESSTGFGGGAERCIAPCIPSVLKSDSSLLHVTCVVLDPVLFLDVGLKEEKWKTRRGDGGGGIGGGREGGEGGSRGDVPSTSVSLEAKESSQPLED